MVSVNFSASNRLLQSINFLYNCTESSAIDQVCSRDSGPSGYLGRNK